MNKVQTKIAINQISQIRAKNNLCWMKLLTLAVEARPGMARKILKQITDNDREITEWVSRI